MEDGAQTLPLPATLEPISRPSSTSSTQASLAQLPGISSIATGSPAAASPQLRATNAPSSMYATSSPAATTPGPGGSLPTCQNCQTSTTPLWRRDEMGSVLCNACGLFLKLHGRPRPISLKTDVIKSRNRVKAMRPEMNMKKKNLHVAADSNGADAHTQSVAAAAAAAVSAGNRRTSGKSINGHPDGSHSPISRTGTPSMYGSHLNIYHGVDDPGFPAQGLPAFPISAASPRAASPMNGERMDVPLTHEQLLANNSSMKTRVSELELVNELYRGRLSQLEQDEANARRGQEIANAENLQMRKDLDDSHRRENMFKRRLDELEVELKEAREAADPHENGRKKKLRVSNVVGDSDTASTPQSTT